MSFSVRGKNAIVTGAGSGGLSSPCLKTSLWPDTRFSDTSFERRGTGINLAFAELLASKGANVVVGDVQESVAFRKLQQKTSGTKVLFQKTDVSSWKDLENVFRFTKSELGTVDLLCNGAGVFEPVRYSLLINELPHAVPKLTVPPRYVKYRTGRVTGKTRKRRATSHSISTCKVF